MDQNRAILQVVWPYLRPVSQRKIRMTCLNIRNWSQDWSKNIPDLKELLNINNWPVWASEAKPQKWIHDWANPIYRWAWIDQRVSIVVRFCKVGDIYLLSNIRVQYEAPQNPDNSYVSIASYRERRDYRVENSGRFGKKAGQLPDNYSSRIYKPIYVMMNRWNGNKKIKRLLLPYCTCIFHRGKIPKEVEWDAKARIYKCDECVKLAKNY